MGKDDIILPGPEDEVREEEGQQEKPGADAPGTVAVSNQGDISATNTTDQSKISATNTVIGQDDSVNQREIAEGPEGGTTPNTGQQQQITTPSTHLYDWGGEGVTLDSVLHGDGKDKPMSQVINDYYSWAGENGITPNVLDIMEAMRDKDISKSAKQNELDEQKRLNKEKWDKVGMFLTHLGNAVGTLAGGGHAPLKLEDPVQWTERQRKLRDATLAQRNAYNQSIFAMQAKAAADKRAADMAKQRQDREDAKLQINREKADAYIQAQRAKANGDDARAAFYDTKSYLLEQGYPLDEAIKEAKKAEIEARTRLNNVKANNVGKTGGKGGGDTVTVEENEYNNDGKVVKKKITKKTGAGGSSSSDEGKGKGY